MPNSFLRVLDAWVAPAGVIVVLVLAIALPLVMGRVILGPLQKAARRASQPTQFYITDFVWLLIQLQAVLGLVAAYVARNPAWAFYLVLGFLACALTAMWWGAVRALSLAGVRGMLRRAVLILVLLPAVEATMVGVLAFVGVGSLVAYHKVRQGARGAGADLAALAGAGFVWLLAAAAGAVLACWLLRRLTLWLVAERSAANERTEAAA